MLLRTTRRTRTLRPIYLHTIRFISTAPIIEIQNGTFYKQYPTGDDAASNPPLYPDLSLTIPSNKSVPGTRSEKQQHWAVIGPSAKSDLLHILRGQYISIPPNARSNPYLLSDEIAAKDPRMRFAGHAIQYIGFNGEGSGAIGGTRGAFLSARYESHREETDWTVEQFLRGQTSLNPLEGEEHGVLHDEEHLRKVVQELRLANLLDMPVANLSNGQTRRARIAKALLRKPELLLLDEPFMGLDPPTVQSLSELLHQLAQECSPRLVLALRPQDTVPEWISHLMLVGNAHQVLKQGARKEVNRTIEVWKHLLVKKPTNTLTAVQRTALQDAREKVKSGVLDDQLLRNFTGIDSIHHVKIHGHPFGGEPLIEMDGVRVQYGDKVVLGDWKQEVDGKKENGLHWKVRRGQRWAILGPNGSGKTTLLSLITSDHPQAYALPIKFFGRSRLPEAGKPGLSLFELQSRLGHSSPEIHAFFPRQLTVREALESAFAETFLSKPKLDHERDLDVSAVLQAFRPELDPDFISPRVHKDLAEIKSYNNMFPTLPSSRSKGYYGRRVPHDAEVDYADEIRFGQLSTSQQRIVLFLRAIVHKPDIIILDEPFSGLTASQRDKCLEFLEHGEHKPTVTNRHAPEVRHTGLSQNQALIMVSHVKEEIPDFVRHFMRLPSTSSEDSEPLDFRVGSLKRASRLGDPSIWNLAWARPSAFRKSARRLSSTKLKGLDDIKKYEWWTI